MTTKSKTQNDNGSTKSTGQTADDQQFLARYGDQLSDSTRRAKWIHSPGERSDRDGQTLATRSQDVVRAWAEERGGRPATVPGTEHNGRPGVLRFDFDGDANDRLQEISWDDWLRTFEERHLVFLYQQNKADGSQSNFFRLDSPEREDA
jgi:hypothetical protein